MYLGIDIGGTAVKVALVNSEGQIISDFQLQTQAFNDIRYLFMEIKSRVKEKVKGVGIGAPNGNFFEGCIENAPNLPWKGIIPARKIAVEVFHTDVVLDNDANAAAWGEKIFGNARTLKNFILITLGTGLGSGIVIREALYRGTSGLAGEMGHVTLIPEGRKCNCGKKGCLETYVSAVGLKKTYMEELEKARQPLPDELSFSARDIDLKAREGDQIALAAFDKTAYFLAYGLGMACNLLFPQAIFISGGLSHAGELLFNPLEKYFNSFLVPHFRNKIHVQLTALNHNQAGVLGAVALVAHPSL